MEYGDTVSRADVTKIEGQFLLILYVAYKMRLETKPWHPLSLSVSCQGINTLLCFKY